MREITFINIFVVFNTVARRWENIADVVVCLTIFYFIFILSYMYGKNGGARF